MKLKFDPTLTFQHDAVNAVVHAFHGQPLQLTGAMAFQALQIGGLFQTELGMGNRLTLPDDEILKNVQAVQEKNGIERASRTFRDASSRLRWRREPERPTSICGRFSS